MKDRTMDNVENCDSYINIHCHKPIDVIHYLQCLRRNNYIHDLGLSRILKYISCSVNLRIMNVHTCSSLKFRHITMREVSTSRLYGLRSHTDGYDEYRYHAVCSIKSQLTFRRNTCPSSWRTIRVRAGKKQSSQLNFNGVESQKTQL
jgi:hypothetical protein